MSFDSLCALTSSSPSSSSTTNEPQSAEAVELQPQLGQQRDNNSGRELMSWEKDTLSSTQFVRLDDDFFFFSVVHSFLLYLSELFLYAQFERYNGNLFAY